MWKSIVVKEISNRNGFNPSSINFSYSYDTIGGNALSHLSAGAHDGSVVLLDEPQQLFLLWIWIEGNQSILERHNLEVFPAEVENVVLAPLQFTRLCLELRGRQNLLLPSLLYGRKFLSLLVWQQVVRRKLRTLLFLLAQVQVLELVNCRLLKSLLSHASCFESPHRTWKNQPPGFVNIIQERGEHVSETWLSR